MAWKYIGEGRYIPGCPTWDMTDEEFAQVEESYDAHFDAAQKGSLRTCGLYRHVDDKATKAAATAQESEG